MTESLDESQYQFVDRLMTAKAAYDALVKKHEPVTRVDKIELLAEYHALKWNPKHVLLDDFLALFKDVIRRMKAANMNETDEFQTAKLLSLMPKEFRTITHVIMEGDVTERTVTAASIKLLAEYKFLQSDGMFRIGSRRYDESAMQVKEGRKKTKKKDKCHKCGQLGHWQRTCPNRKLEDAPARANVVVAVNEDSLFTVKETIDRPRQRIVMDSGASCHLTGDLNLLYDQEDCARAVVVADGRKIRITKKGKLKVEGRRTDYVLSDVLYHPSLKNTLISIPRIMVDHVDDNAKVVFTGSHCVLFMGGLEALRASFIPESKLFVVPRSENAMTVAEVVDEANLAASSVAELWHYRMGHLPLATMKLCAVDHLGLPNLERATLQCESC
ncbi:hypothetical protein DYB32_008843, partial [Aphanomyces invadans]